MEVFLQSLLAAPPKRGGLVSVSLNCLDYHITFIDGYIVGQREILGVYGVKNGQIEPHEKSYN